MNRSNEVWLVLPSANPENCQRTLPVWRAMGYRIAVLQDELRFAVDADAVLEVDRYEGWAWAVNRLCAQVVPESCGVVVAAGDDMLPDPDRTAQEIASEYLDRFPDGFGVMQPIGDRYMLSDTYCGSPWFGRGWMQRAFEGCGPLPVGYRHNWADMELHWVARGLGVFWMRDDLTQHHEHFARNSQAEMPEYWKKSAAGFDLADCERFIERAWAGFPGCEPLGVRGLSYDHSVFLREYRSIAEVHQYLQTGRSPWDACRRMREAFEVCAQRGWTRIGIYGNGAHTEAVWGQVELAGVKPIVIIDDHAEPMSETRRDGIPVCKLPEALDLDLHAVVLSANSIEEQLFDNAMRLGVPVVRLYGEISPRVIEAPFPARSAMGIAQ